MRGQMLMLWCNHKGGIFLITLLCLLFLRPHWQVWKPSEAPPAGSVSQLVVARQEPWETIKFISHLGKLRPRKKSPGKAEMTLGPTLALLLFIHGSTYGTSQRVISVQNRKGQQRILWATVTATLLVSFPSLIVWLIPLYNHPPHSAQSTDLGVQGNRFAWLISYLLSCPAGLEMANK